MIVIRTSVYRETRAGLDTLRVDAGLYLGLDARRPRFRDYGVGIFGVDDPGDLRSRVVRVLRGEAERSGLVRATDRAIEVEADLTGIADPVEVIK